MPPVNGHNEVLKVKGVVRPMLIIQIAQGDEGSCHKTQTRTGTGTGTLRSQPKASGQDTFG